MTWKEDIDRSECFLVIGTDNLFGDPDCYSQAKYAAEKNKEFTMLLKEGTTIPDGYPLPEGAEVLHWSNNEELKKHIEKVMGSNGVVTNEDLNRVVVNSHEKTMVTHDITTEGVQGGIDMVDTICSLDKFRFYASIRETLVLNIQKGKESGEKWIGFTEFTLMMAYFDAHLMSEKTDEKRVWWCMRTILEMFISSDNGFEVEKRIPKEDIAQIQGMIDMLGGNEGITRSAYKVLLECCATVISMNLDRKYVNGFIVALAYFIAAYTNDGKLMQEHTSLNYKQLMLDRSYLIKVLKENRLDESKVH